MAWLCVFLRQRRDGDAQAATLAEVDDAVLGPRRLHCDLADRAGLWRLWALLHVSLGYRLRDVRFDLNQKSAAAWVK